jgi:hypothetical protein
MRPHLAEVLMDEREKRARERVRRVLAGALVSLSKKGGRQFFRAHIAVAELDVVLAAAREGDKEAIGVLRERGRAMRSSQAIVPDDFHTFVWELFLDGAPKGRPGPKPYDLMTRDMIIAATVKILAQDYGYSPTRGEAAKQASSTVSACQIVSEELPKGHKRSEAEVEQIWKDSEAKARWDREQRP